MGIVVRRDIVTRRVSGCDPKGREGCEVANTGIDGKGGWIKVEGRRKGGQGIQIERPTLQIGIVPEKHRTRLESCGGAAPKAGPAHGFLLG